MTPDTVAAWMLTQVEHDGCIYQDNVVDYLALQEDELHRSIHMNAIETPIYVTAPLMHKESLHSLHITALACKNPE